MVKNLPTKESSGPDDLKDEFYETFRESLTSMLMKMLPKKLQRKENFQTFSMRSVQWLSRVRLFATP